MRSRLILVLVVLVASGCSRRLVNPPAERILQRGADNRYDYILTEALRQKYVGDVNEAATLFEKCIEIDRSRAVPWFELAQMYSSAGMGEKALEHASMAARLEPGNYWYQMACGSLLTQYNMKDSAIVYFTRALKADKGAVAVNGILAGLYAEKGDLEKADSLFRTLDREGVMSEDMALMMISGLIMKNDLKEAANRSLALIKQYPGEIRYKALLADIYYEDGLKEKSDSIYRNIIENNPEDIETQLLFMMNQFYKKEYSDISGFLEKIFESDVIERERKVAIAGRVVSDSVYVRDNAEILAGTLIGLEKKYPGDTEILSLRPGVFETAGMTEEAINRYEEIIDGGVGEFYFRERLILLYAEKKEYTKLYDLAANYSRENNRSIIGKVYYAIAAMELKEYQVADMELKKAMILAGNDPGLQVQILSMQGDLKYRMKDYEGSYGYYEDALRISPDEPLILNNYAYFLAEGGRDLKKALKMAEKVMKTEGNNPTYIDTYAWILYKMGKYRDAHREMMKIFVDSEEQDPELLEHMGFIMEALGNCNEAIRYWNMALEKDNMKTYLKEEIRQCGRK